MRDDLLEHILVISRRMAEIRELTSLLNYVMDEAMALVGAERGYVVLIHPNGVLGVRVMRGMGGESLRSAEDQVSSHSYPRHLLGLCVGSSASGPSCAAVETY